jgi:hypothetical protein
VVLKGRGFWSLFENSRIPAFAGMTALSGDPKSGDVIPANAGIHCIVKRELSHTLFQPWQDREGHALKSRCAGSKAF